MCRHGSDPTFGCCVSLALLRGKSCSSEVHTVSRVNIVISEFWVQILVSWQISQLFIFLSFPFIFLFLCSSTWRPRYHRRACGEPESGRPAQSDMSRRQCQTRSLDHLDPKWRGAEWSHILKGKVRGIEIPIFSVSLGTSIYKYDIIYLISP